MQRLKFADASFLYAETAHARMNIASVQLLEVPPAQHPGFFERVRTHVAANAGRISFMTRRLVDAPFGLDQPIWVTDTAFDVNNHVHRRRLPAPGSPEQLERLVAQLHERQLDRRRPLWEFYLIEGLDDGRFAWYTKYHHACIDGMAGQQIIDVLFSDTPNGVPAVQPAPVEPEREPSLAVQWFDAVTNISTEPLRNFMRLSRTMEVSARIQARVRDPERAGAYAMTPPRTRFNTTVSEYRNVAFGSLPLNQLRAVGKTQGASINDMFMAACAGGLRRYLKRHGELPEVSLTAGVPVSMRKPGDDSMDNRVSMLLASLATDIDDPLEQLAAIRTSMRAGKAMVADQAELPGADPHVAGMPLMAASMAQFAENLHVAETAIPSSNVVISNVPGPRVTKYLCGAKMTTHYPVSIAANGTALNITVQSYRNRMDFSVTACLEAVPDAQLLRDDVIAAWHALRAAHRGASAQRSPSRAA